MPIRRLSLSLLLLTVPALAAEPLPRTDRHGDPLPDGVLVRLGTSRLEHRAGARLVRFAPDGKLLASVGAGGVVRLWDAASGKEIVVLSRLRSDVEDLAFSPDSKQFVVATGRALRFFATADGAEIPTGNQQPICTHLVYAPDGQTLAGGGGGGRILLWDSATGKRQRDWDAHDGGLRSLVFTPDGRTLVSTGLSAKRFGDPAVFSCKHWDPATGKLLAEAKLPAHLDNPLPWGFSDGKHWALLCDNVVSERQVLWQPATGKELPPPQKTPIERVLGTSPDGRRVAAISGTTMHVWDVATGQRVDDSAIKAPDHLLSAALAPGGNTLAAMQAFADREAVRVWDLAVRDAQPPLEPLGRWLTFESHAGPITAIEVADHGRTVATGSADGTVRLWDTATGRHRGCWPLDERKSLRVERLVFGRQGRLLAAVDDLHVVTVIDVSQPKPLGQLALKPSHLAFTPDGKTLVLATDTTLHRYEVPTLKPIDTRALGDGTRAAALSPDGSRLVVFVERGSTYKVMDVATAKTTHDLQPRTDRLRLSYSAVSYSPDGLLVFLVTENKVLYFDPASGVQLADLAAEFQARHTMAARVSPDGRLLIVKDSRGQHVLDLLTGKNAVAAGILGRASVFAFARNGRSIFLPTESSAALLWDLDGSVPADPVFLADRKSESLRTLWNEMGTLGLESYRVFHWLERQPDAALALLQAEMKPARMPDDQRLTQLLDDLDSRNFTARQSATDELARLGRAVEPALRRMKEAKPPLEVMQRLDKLLLRIESPALERRFRMGIRLLESNGTREARQLLQELTASLDPLVAHESKAALERVAAE